MTVRSPRLGPAYLRAVVDTLLPGDDGDPPLPPGSGAGVMAQLEARLASREGSVLGTVLDAVARTAGGEAAFVRAGSARRAATVRAVEPELPDAFAALVLGMVEDYYDADAVLLALGWRVEPPQPNGHPLPAFDGSLLSAVRERAPMWRDPERRT